MRLLSHMLYFFFKVRKWTTYMINLLINLSKICRERYLSSLSKETLTMVFNSIPTLTKVLRLDLITDYDERVRLRNKFIIENPEVVFWDYLEYHHETGYFKSSNRIISTEGNVITLNNKGLFIIKSQERPSSYYVSIQDPLKTISMVVHRAVASTFIPRPSFLQGISFEQLEVNHKDRIRNNNFTANLEWTTRSGNNLHATRMIDYQESMITGPCTLKTN